MRTMRAIAAASLVLAILGLPNGAGAGQTTSVVAHESFNLMAFNMLSPSNVFLSVQKRTGASSTSSTATPTATYEAVGYITSCSDSCASISLPQQQVSPTALSFDPLGNSGSFRASLVRASETPGPNVVVDLSFVRPIGIFPCAACVTANGWVDPTTNTAAIVADARPGIARNGYTISGTINGQTVSFPPPYWVVDDSYRSSIDVRVTAVAP
ncbi:MAG TPA: hypothetical protein VM600_05365 [Actinomycetota bacterium]|nr:hypothetical protein [Actinomycetota bacterium]